MASAQLFKVKAFVNLISVSHSDPPIVEADPEIAAPIPS
jgi:hypothetical protein